MCPFVRAELIAFCSGPVRKEIFIRSLLNCGLRSSGTTEKVKNPQDLLSFIKIKDYPQHRQVCLIIPLRGMIEMKCGGQLGWFTHTSQI